jgi:secernin
MCDTFVAVKSHTKDQSVILGKNSDRQPNEPQEILRFAGGKTKSQTLQCTYIEIPQVEETNAVVLCKPSWMWGAEMGMNDKGVAIGNEAVWTIFDKQNRKERLLGMDMLRIALERANTSRQALDVITHLLKEYGQGGNCGFDKKEYYDNSFIIADPTEAWVLETAGKFWIAEKVSGIRSISNTLTIENNYDLIHSELIPYAIENKLCQSVEDFNFKKLFSDKYNIIRIGAKGEDRAACTLKTLKNADGKVTVDTAFTALRDHNTQKLFNPRKNSMKSPCLHASSLLTPSQTTSSMVAHLTDSPLTWITGTSAPCISIFKPIGPVGTYELKPLPLTYDKKDESLLWWKHEHLHRLVIMNYNLYKDLFIDDLMVFEKELLDKVTSITQDHKSNLDLTTFYNDLDDITNTAFVQNLELIVNWFNCIKSNEIRTSFSNLRYQRYWNKLNKKAKLI